MALPIAPTPILEGQEAVDFLEKLQREENEKVPLWAPTSKLEAISKKILTYNKGGK